MNGTEEDIKRQTEEMLEKRQLAKQTKAAKVRRMIRHMHMLVTTS